MNNSTKLLRALSCIAAKRNVSSIRPRTESVIYNGQTYTKQLYPHTLTAIVVNYPWKLYWQKFTHFRMICYSAILILPIAIYTNYYVFAALIAAKRAEKKAMKEAKKAGIKYHH